MTFEPPDARERDLARRLAALPDAAPPGLRARVDALVLDADVRRRRRTRRSAAASAVLAAACAAVAAVLLIGTSPAPPAVPAVARVALTAASGPPPAVDPLHPARLAAHVDDVAFPRWGGSVGFWPVGERAARLDGRHVLAVAYRSSTGTEVGYAIVARPPVTGTAGTVRTLYGVRFVVGRAGNATTVTWQRAGHTCVLAARGVPATTLVTLAMTTY